MELTANLFRFKSDSGTVERSGFQEKRS